VLLLEHCNGGNLEDFINRVQRDAFEVSTRTLIRIALSLAMALTQLHRAERIHGNLNPFNILLIISTTGEVISAKVGGFGAAVWATWFAAPQLLGLAAFAAPELFLPMEPGVCEYTPKADVWALGAVLFALVFGHRPFDQGVAVQADAVAQAHIRDGQMPDVVRYCLVHRHRAVLEMVEEYRGQIAAADPALAAVCDVIRDCLALDPNVRPTAADLLERLVAAHALPP
jgi:serine/threonine protein kinase